ncbi:MAG: RluA family pseudouridine synthase, partial [Elusimicrobiota bacterium]
GLSVVFEDETVVALSKPAGQPTIPGRGEVGRSLLTQLEEDRGAKFFIVHRLDREASGLVIFAKNAEIHRRLCLEFEARRAKKVYLALVAGRMEGEGRITQPLREFGSGRMGPSREGKPSTTLWSVEQILGGASLLRVEPLTGRKHQIRAHLAFLGHPILGDPRYGPSPRPVGGVRRLMLHGLSLRVEASRVYEFSAPLPADFASILSGR